MNIKKLFSRSNDTPAQRAARQLVAQADRHRDAKSWADAARDYGAALEHDAGMAHIWVQRGHALKEMGQREDAESAYLKALALQPEVADTHLQLGHLTKIMGRPQDAARYYLRCLELDPAHPDALRELQAVTASGEARLPPEQLKAALRRVPGGGELEQPVDDVADRGAFEAASKTAFETPSGSAGTVPPSVAVLQKQLGDLIATLKQQHDDRQSSVQSGLQLTVEPDSLQSLHTAFAVLQEMESRATVAAAASATVHGESAKWGTDTPCLVFDVSDLIQYFRNARLPTGIQRVQLETITSLLSDDMTRHQVRLCCFIERRDYWLEVPALTFMRICRLSLADGDAKAPQWTGAVSQLDILLNTSDAFVFPQGAYLINLGTSWWLQNYFLYVRLAKQRYGIRYVPFVHDLIPVMTPEHCIKELTQDFITWILGAFQHADFFLANSEATKRDLLEVARTLGHTVHDDAVTVIPLNADVRKPVKRILGPEALATRGLERTPFVLFVSTIESRKNHIGALNAWLRLIREHGARDVPMLVCVGNRGWLNDAVFAKLDGSAVLRQRVMMLSGISDEELSLLYRHSMFTLYPSHYEGWGLPVTESLCYGKVPLVSDASSLPESGGEFAEYFENGSDAKLYAALERLMFDEAYRRGKEKIIAERFKPRAWHEVGLQIEQSVTRWESVLRIADLRDGAPGTSSTASRTLMQAELGRYYPIVRNYETQVWRGMAAGEMFRISEGWWWPDAWGCWTKAQGGSLAFSITTPAQVTQTAPTARPRELRGYFGLLGLPNVATQFYFEVDGGTPVEGRLEAGQTKWLALDFTAPAGDELVRISLRSDGSTDLAVLTDRLDQRVVGIGFIGFFVCDVSDLRRRVEFVEAYTLGNLAELARVGKEERRLPRAAESLELVLQDSAPGPEAESARPPHMRAMPAIRHGASIR
jgi:glycosyltransferase involved in cell wall biosynthesis